MRRALISLSFALLFAALLSGCGPVHPMSESEFKGFCYQTGEPRFADCDTISVCNPYATAMNLAEPSLGKCLAECDAVHSAQYMTYAATGCAVANESAWDWCQKYCRTNYQK